MVVVCFFLLVANLCFSQDGWTALMNAASKGHLGVVALLLDRGANMEAANNVIVFQIVQNKVVVIVGDVIDIVGSCLMYYCSS